MYNNIIFIGGIHGVGKGTICEYLSSKLNIKHISASELIKWRNSSNKLVENIQKNQDELVLALNYYISPDENYLFDGHFCLISTDESIKKVPLITFQEISPILIIVIVEEIKTIQERLEKREHKKYDFDLLKKLQDTEITYANHVSNILNIKIIIVNSNEKESLYASIKILLQDK